MVDALGCAHVVVSYLLVETIAYPLSLKCLKQVQWR